MNVLSICDLGCWCYVECEYICYTSLYTGVYEHNFSYVRQETDRKFTNKFKNVRDAILAMFT